MKKLTNKDPFAEREAERYPNPVPSREYILQFLMQQPMPLSLLEIYKAFKIKSAEQKEAIRRRLIAMVRDGQLESLHKKYWPIEKNITIKGTLHFDKRGVLWCIPEQGGAKFPVVHAKKDLNWHGSKAIVAIPAIPDVVPHADIRGRLVEVLQTHSLRVIGRFMQNKNNNYVIPHGKDIVQDIEIPPGKDKGAREGDIVLVEILSKQSTWSDVTGNVLEIIGQEDSKGIEVDAAIRAYSLSYQWPAEVEQEIAELRAKQGLIPLNTVKNRVDLRDLSLVTIDGEDAKDFDDAVFCTPTSSGGWKLYVAIADVSHYVHVNSYLDKESSLRGNSVYFPSKVIPMLPEVLSNGLCSLLPEQDRLCVVCEMLINNTGELTRSKFYEAVMHSKARLTYTKVAKILAGESKHLLETYADLVEHLKNLQKLYLVLAKQRQIRGALDFDTVENRIIFDDFGKIKKIEPAERNIAHHIIEECMLCANVSTAKFLIKHNLPGLYRVHEGPTADKLADLQAFLDELGLGFLKKKQQPTSLDYARLMQKVQHRPDAHIIKMLLLRSLGQAVYSPDNLGHFGLAFSAYSHFTSPIRRYPDLIVHRQIKLVLHGKWHTKKTNKTLDVIAKQNEKLKELAYHCSITERRADDATRDVELWLKCQYIAKMVGQIFTGVISGVSSFGFFVQLDDIYVDGLVHVNTLRDDYYVFNHVRHQLIGERTKKLYSLGLPVKVVVAKVNVDERKIDFSLVDGPKVSQWQSQVKKKAKNHKYRKENKRK